MALTTLNALHTVTGLRSAAFDLVDEAAHRDTVTGARAETVDHLQQAANELGAVEDLLEQAQAPFPGELRRRRYWARAQSDRGRCA